MAFRKFTSGAPFVVAEQFFEPEKWSLRGDENFVVKFIHLWSAHTKFSPPAMPRTLQKKILVVGGCVSGGCFESSALIWTKKKLDPNKFWYKNI